MGWRSSSYTDKLKKNRSKKGQLILGIFLLVFVIIACLIYVKCSDKDINPQKLSEAAHKQVSETKSFPENEGPEIEELQDGNKTDNLLSSEQVEQNQTETDIEVINIDDNLLDGPILYHYPENQPIYLIIVEKASQQLYLYEYQNQEYKLVKTYPCATGKNNGKKQRENDKKTPEGVYFNVKTYLDNKITIFGDRAFGLNYPDVFDKLVGNGGNGIFIHGSNKPVTEFSTNGCVVLKTNDLAQMDKLIEIENSPIIMTENVSYRFYNAKHDISELIPFFRQAMIPDDYSQMQAQFDTITVLSFKDRIVAIGRITIKDQGQTQLNGVSRLYLAGPMKNFLVLVKREWTENNVRIAKPAPLPEQIDKLIESWRVTWERKNIDLYISKYHSDFISPGDKNLIQWKEYKKSLNKRYENIYVKIYNLKIKATGKGTLRAFFQQDYISDDFVFEGYKILEFRKEKGEWKIFREKSFVDKPDNWTRCYL